MLSTLNIASENIPLIISCTLSVWKTIKQICILARSFVFLSPFIYQSLDFQQLSKIMVSKIFILILMNGA